MLEKLAENLFKEPTYLDLVKRCNMPKEDWEKHKQKLLKEFEEADKYFEEKEKEEKKPILTDEEREYLRFVIKPFREKIATIVKYENNSSNEFIKIYFNTHEVMWFPDFPIGTKYKGMEINIPYTLEELGL